MRTTILVILSAVIVGGALGFFLGYHTSQSAKWVSSLEEAGIKIDEKKEPEKENYDASDPIVKVDNPIHDFGILEKNEKTEKGEHDFILENVGGSELTLSEAGKGCMCTNFTIVKKSLKKGEKTAVKYRWDASRGGGIFDQAVRVATNDPKHKEVYLTVRGLYTSSIVANPNQLVFSGIPFGNSAVREFKLFGFEKEKDGSPFPLKVESATVSDSAHFALEYTKGSLTDLTPEEKKHKLFTKATSVFLCKLTLKPGLPQGAFQEVIRFKTNDQKLPIMEMMVEGQIAGAITIMGNKYDRRNTGHLVIGSVSAGKTTKERIRLTIVDKFEANEKTVSVSHVHPSWVKVEFHYPDKEAQKSMPVKMVDVDIIIPKGSPQGNYIGPSKDKLGEVVFQIGPDEKNVRDIVLPLQFAVGP
ncbi:MAG: DUF1573 domain-containing protein [Planctomycetia bacterium]|nr:DUF1573 domain-containing protein [Planctomycetia bacterium]